MYQDWALFLAWLASEYAARRDVKELNAIISDQPIRWRGTIGAVEIEGRIAPALTMRMQPAKVALPDGLMLDGEHLSLPIRGDIELAKAAKTRAGQVALFSARIARDCQYFPPLDFLLSKSQHCAFVMLGLEKVELLEISP